MNDADIDSALLSAIGTDWTKAAITVGRTGHSLGVRYAVVAARMSALIAQGLLVSDGGDLSDGRTWLKLQVRRSN